MNSMSDVVIRLISEHDIEFVYTLCKNEHWNYSRKMIKRLIGYEPNGCFIAEVDGTPVGHVFSINYGKIGWIGLLIVERKYRRQGVGTRLMKHVMGYLLNLGVETIRLEAVPKIMSLYQKLGFIEEFDSLRFEGINEKAEQSTNSYISLISENEIAKIAKFDEMYFGVNRERVLRKLYADNPETCFAARENSKIVGYIFCCRMEIGYRIGPWVCIPNYVEIAKQLILKCMEIIEANAKLYVGVPGVNEAAVRLLQDLKFRLCPKSIRMYFGRKLESDRIQGIFSISGPEKG